MGCPLANKVVPALSPAHCRFSIPGSMMKRMSFSETIFLFFLALIIFGPKKLPEIARYVGKTLAEFRRASNEFKAQIEQEIANIEVDKRQTILPPSPAPEGTASRSLSAAPSEASPAQATLAEAVPPEATGASVASPAASDDDEPLFATGAATSKPEPPTVATQTPPPSDSVSTPASQESHA
jgi:sec-independent protein translocase protein TatB